MRYAKLGVLLIFMATGAFAATGTLSADTSGSETGTFLPKGKAGLILQDDFGGGTVTLECAAEQGGTFVAVPSASWTDDTAYAVDTGAPEYCRLQLTGSTNPTINYWLIPNTSN